ncbi:MAG: right-handed parallel beta-helix repeat-containing protein [Verrucomicrobiota bacterium]
MPRGLFFYADGGAIKVFGASFPTLRHLQIENNYASPCAGGVSVEHAGHGGGNSSSTVVLENCIFRNNRAQITGAAVDLLPGSSAIISNCLFVGNIANLGVNYISDNKAAPEFTNSAPLTVFPGSRVTVLNSTFTGNRDGAEDLGQQSVYQNCLFWKNSMGGAFYEGDRYDLNVGGAAQVDGCFFGGAVLDPNHVISPTTNKVIALVDPLFDVRFQAKAAQYENVGFRPVGR